MVFLQIHALAATLLESFIADNYTLASFAACLSIPRGWTCVAAFAAVFKVVMQDNAFAATFFEVFIACNYALASLAACPSIPRGRTCVPAFAAVCKVVLQIDAFLATLRVNTPATFAKHSSNKAGKQNEACERHFERDAMCYPLFLQCQVVTSVQFVFLKHYRISQLYCRHGTGIMYITIFRIV